ncbi:cysteine proteinase [Amanita muscaria]
MSEAESNSGSNRWIPLESNPEVFNEWAQKSGLATSQVCFHDVYGLEEELLELVPKPAKAVILLFPLDGAIKEQRQKEDEELSKQDQPLVDKTILWIKQTISNACGTMALLHAIANTNVTIAPESALAKFIEHCKGKTPLERAHLLETTPLFTEIHAELAEEGQTPVPTNLDTDLHFTCFILTPSQEKREIASSGVDTGKSGKEIQVTGSKMRLIELDGTRQGPVDRGESSEHDFLKDVGKIIKKIYFTNSDTMLFSLMALAPPPPEDF